MICCIVSCSYFRCWCVNNAWCNGVAFLILVINNNITVLFWSLHKIIVVNNIGIAFYHLTSFSTLGRCQIQLVLLAIYCSDSVLTLISSIVVSTHFRTRCIGHFRCDSHAVFVLVLNGNITVFLLRCIRNKIIVVNNIGIAFYHLTSFSTLGRCQIQLVLLAIHYSSNGVLTLISSIVIGTHFRTRCIDYFRCNGHTIFVLVLNGNITVFLFWCIRNKIIVVNNIGIAFHHLTSFSTLGCCQIQLVLLAIYCGDSVLTLISSIIIGTHFRTRCIGHFRCDSHAVFVLVLNGNITVFLLRCIRNKIIVVNNIGIAFYHLTSFSTLGRCQIQLVLLAVYCGDGVLTLILGIIVCTDFRTRCIGHFRCNGHTIFVLILDGNITIFLFYRLFNFVINIDNAGCSFDNLTTLVTLCSIGINTISCAIIRRNGSWFVISCVIVSANP